jgi:Glycosyl transferase family 90/Methyltransferase domain
MIDFNAAGKAIAEGRLQDAWTGSISLIPSNADGSLAIIEWRPNRSQVVLHRTLRESPRLPFFAYTIPPILAVLEAAVEFASGALSEKPVLLNLDDAPPAPIGIAFCVEGNNQNILVPDANFVRNNAYQGLRQHYADRLPWNRRIPVAFWRGGTSGRYPGGDWHKLQRLELCRIARLNPDIDAGISHIVQLPKGAEDEVRTAGLLRKWVPAETFRYYGAHIAIDGNSWPTGLYVSMLTGAPVLKVTSPYGFRQWWYDRIQPWVHYVPVEADMSDLVDKTKWVLEDGERAEKIGLAARAVTLAMTLSGEVSETGQRLAKIISSGVKAKASAGNLQIIKRLPKPNLARAPQRGIEDMTSRASAIMERLYGSDVYAGFVPTFSADLQGWNSQHPCFREIIGSTRPDTVLDVGVWKGASTIFLANLLRENGIDGAVIGIDTFLGSPDHSDRNTDQYHLIPRQFGRPLLFEQFMANVIHCKAKDIIVPLAQSTDNAAELLRRAGVRAGLIHIDAAHDYASVLRDSRLYWTLLAPGGYLIGDDYHPTWPGVVKAADEFSTEIGIPIEVRLPKWIVRKPA